MAHIGSAVDAANWRPSGLADLVAAILPPTATSQLAGLEDLVDMQEPFRAIYANLNSIDFVLRRWQSATEATVRAVVLLGGESDLPMPRLYEHHGRGVIGQAPDRTLGVRGNTRQSLSLAVIAQHHTSEAYKAFLAQVPRAETCGTWIQHPTEMAWFCVATDAPTAIWHKGCKMVMFRDAGATSFDVYPEAQLVPIVGKVCNIDASVASATGLGMTSDMLNSIQVDAVPEGLHKLWGGLLTLSRPLGNDGPMEEERPGSVKPGYLGVSYRKVAHTEHLPFVEWFTRRGPIVWSSIPDGAKCLVVVSIQSQTLFTTLTRGSELHRDPG